MSALPKQPNLEFGKVKLVQATSEMAKRIVGFSRRYREVWENFMLFDSENGLTVEMEAKYLNKMRTSKTDLLWAITTPELLKEFEQKPPDEFPLIGTIGLHEHDPQLLSGRLGIIMWDGSQQGKGYGTDAIFALLQFAFEKLKLQRVDAVVRELNKTGQKYYIKKIGFVAEGVRRRAYPLHGVWQNLVTLGMTFEDWEIQKAKLEEVGDGRCAS